jgi:DNA (cytosine-5)-methyltransferase 1
VRDRPSECVGYCEIDPYAISIYRRHWPGHRNLGDATRIDPAGIPDFDLLVGGFPCPDFSIAGKRRGLADPRGRLFFEIMRIARHKRPQHLLLENVLGLLSHDEGRTFLAILEALDEVGYDAEWQTCNGKYWVPQNRDRIFIVGHLRGGCSCQVFPLGEGPQVGYGEDREGGGEGERLATALDTGYAKGPDGKRSLIQLGDIGDENRQAHRVYDPAGVAKTIAGCAGGQGAKTGLYLVEDRDEGGGDMKSGVRRLMPVECERLMNFPDQWTEYGIDAKGNEVKISDSQRYKVLGNAVISGVVAEIVGELLRQWTP